MIDSIVVQKKKVDVMYILCISVCTSQKRYINLIGESNTIIRFFFELDNMGKLRRGVFCVRLLRTLAFI